jgi:hypothetical protein
MNLMIDAIKHRQEQLGVSDKELCESIGYASIEMPVEKLPLCKVSKAARVLKLDFDDLVVKVRDYVGGWD